MMVFKSVALHLCKSMENLGVWNCIFGYHVWNRAAKNKYSESLSILFNKNIFLYQCGEGVSFV